MFKIFNYNAVSSIFPAVFIILYYDFKDKKGLH